jgi:hypothetical protein
MDGGRQPAGVPADSAGVVLPAWRALRVRAGIAVGAILLLVLGSLLLPPAIRLLLTIGVGGLVVLGLISWGIWRSPSYRLELLLWPLGGLALLVAFFWFTLDQLTGQIWVTFYNDRVAVLQGAGPDGHMGTQNIDHVEQSPSAAHRGQVSALFATALDRGIGVGSQGEGEQIARCLPWMFTPTIDTPPDLKEACRDAAFATTPVLPVPDHYTVDTTDQTPAVAATDNQVLLAWTDRTNGGLQVSRSEDGVHFTSPEPLGDEFASDLEPALATDGSRFFLAWRDQLSGNLAVASSPDGRDFGEPERLQETTQTAPALAYGNGTLLLAWAGDRKQLHLWPAEDADPSSFNRNSSCLRWTRPARQPPTFSTRTVLGTSPGPGLNRW